MISSDFVSLTAIFTALFMASNPIEIDPTPYTAWGVVGTLAFTIVVLCSAVVVILVSQRGRDRMLMDFVDKQRKETAQTLGDFGDVLRDGLSTMTTAFDRQSNRMNEVLMTGKVMEQVRAYRRRGEQLDDTTISSIVSEIKKQSNI